MNISKIKATGTIEFNNYGGCLAPDGGGIVRADVLAKGKDKNGNIFTFGNQCNFLIQQKEDGFLDITVRSMSQKCKKGKFARHIFS